MIPLPWLELAILLPLLGAVWVRSSRCRPNVGAALVSRLVVLKSGEVCPHHGDERWYRLREPIESFVERVRRPLERLRLLPRQLDDAVRVEIHQIRQTLVR